MRPLSCANKEERVYYIVRTCDHLCSNTGSFLVLIYRLETYSFVNRIFASCLYNGAMTIYLSMFEL